MGLKKRFDGVENRKVGPLALLLKPASELLLRWYLAEVRKLDIPQAPNETIHTYPLA